MLRGDLSSDAVPKNVLIFEGALGFIDRKSHRQFAKHLSHQRWDDAASLWVLSEPMMHRIWYVVRHRNVILDIVTFEGPPQFGEALEHRLQYAEELPIHRAWATRPELLARKIAYMPDLAVIYDPNPKRWLTWGGKGRYLTSIDQLGEM